MKSVYTLRRMYAPTLTTYRSPLSDQWRAAVRRDAEIAATDALPAVAGYSAFNDVSVRGSAVAG